MSVRVVACAAGGDLCCMEDPDDPCFQPFIGPPKRKVTIRYSARFTQQMRTLSGDRRWPLAPVVARPALRAEGDRDGE